MSAGEVSVLGPREIIDEGVKSLPGRDSTVLALFLLRSVVGVMEMNIKFDDISDSEQCWLALSHRPH